MKKLKKMLVVLSAVMVISTCAISVVYADEAITKPTELTTENVSEEKITDLEEIKGLIENFIKEQNLSSCVGIDTMSDIDGNEFHSVWIKTFHWEIDRISDFIFESNIDDDKVQFFVLQIALADPPIKGDVNIDGTLDVRDCAFIVSRLAKGEELSDIADYNSDGKADVRDAAAIARDLAKGKI